MFYRKTKDGIILNLLVLPKSSKDMIVGVLQDCLKVKITKAPVDNLANMAIISFLSKKLKISKSSIEIVSGSKNKRKQLLIKNKDEQIIKSLMNLTN